MPSMARLVFICCPLLVRCVYARALGPREADATQCGSDCTVPIDVNSTSISPSNVTDFSNASFTGENDFYEPNDLQVLCPRGEYDGAACSSDSKSESWYDEQGKLKGFRDLSEAEYMGLWDEVTVTGDKVKALMDFYVSRRRSRLGELDLPEDGHFSKYKTARVDDWDLIAADSYAGGANMAFEQAGLTNLDLLRGFELVEYVSRVPPPSTFRLPATVLALAMNAAKGTVVSMWDNQKNDFNPKALQAYSYTLTWKAWAKQATGKKVRPSTLKYHLRHRVAGTLATNLLAIAHENWGLAVDQIPNDDHGDPLPVQAGHGRWTPDHPAFATLLAIPDVHALVNLVVDYNDQMENPYIAVIHTYPAVSVSDFKDVPAKFRRDAEILIEYGQMPGMGRAHAADTVVTS